MHKVCVQSQNETNGFPIFVSFCPVKSIQQLADGPTIYVGSQDQRICFVSSANQLSLLPCQRLAPSFPLTNSTGQKLTNVLYIRCIHAAVAFTLFLSVLCAFIANLRG